MEPRDFSGLAFGNFVMTDISGARTLHRLLYCSAVHPDCRSQFSTPGETIKELIEVSVRNNSRVAVTGVLLVHSDWFLQVLEGPANAVMETYSRILADKRHLAAKVIQAGPILERNFSDWSMCARHLSPMDDAILETLNLRGRFDPRKLSALSSLNLLSAVKSVQSRATAAAPA